MKCPRCGSDRIKEKDNFCGECGAKLKRICDCWIKKGSYDCEEDNCPGYKLFAKEARSASRTRQEKKTWKRKIL